MEERKKIDWEGHANRLIDVSITALQNKFLGVRTSTGAGVSLGPSAISVWSSTNIVPYLLLGGAIIGAVLIFKK